MSSPALEIQSTLNNPRPLAPVVSESTTKRRRLPTLLTARGLVLILLAIYLALGPSAQQSDIIASILAFTIMAILSLSLIVTVTIGSRFRSLLGVEVNSGTEELHAGDSTQLFVRLTNLRIPPLFTLSIHVRFVHPILPVVWHHLVGRGSYNQGIEGSARIVAQSVTFPHRGRWRVAGVDFRFGDRLGLTEIGWEVVAPPADESKSSKSNPHLGEFVVRPAQQSQAPLPVLTSSTRPGDDWSDIQNQHGDPFDLKRYQPGDGLRKIVWKLYAKSGELLARHPEPACTPEGTVVVFTLAGKDEDNVAATTVNYLRQLSNLEIISLSAVEGDRTRQVSTNIDDCENALIDNVWNAEHTDSHDTQTHLTEFISAVRGRLGDSVLSRVIIFVSARRIASDRGLDALLSLGTTLEQLSISPVYFICDGSLLHNTEQEKEGPFQGIWHHLIESQTDGTISPKSVPSAQRGRFIAGCAAKGWQVVVCDGVVF